MRVSQMISGGSVRPLKSSLSEWARAGFAADAETDPRNQTPRLHWLASYNPLADHVLPSGPPDDTQGIICWSGTLADTLLQRDPRTWGPAGFEALHAAMRGLEFAAIRHGFRVLFRTHARHVLGDPQRCLKFLSDLGGRPFGIALDPASMFEASMLPHAEDHLRRMFESLGPRCSAVILANVAAPGPLPDDSLDDAALTLTPLAAGVLDPLLMVELTQAHVPPSIPVLTPAG